MTKILVFIYRRIKILTVFYAVVFSMFTLKAQTPAFPGAEGFGKNTTGGRGGAVIEVTNLNDNGPGSFRAAVEASGPRTVVFRVSGTIFLESGLRIKNDDITIAGQTAPGDGITLANYNFKVDANNVILRYIRSRMGDLKKQEDDAFTCINYSNIIIDHCSFSWGIDETASCYENTNFTMQWCIIGESLYHSYHSKGDHGYGGIWGGDHATFHHNLLIHNSSRNPRFNGARYRANWNEQVDFRNNAIYNWGFNSSYGGDPSEVDGAKAHINMVRNYYKAGPATRSGELQYRILEPYEQPGYGFSYWYIDSNKVANHPEVFGDNWLYGVQGISESTKAELKVDLPFGYEITTDQPAEKAFDSVLAYAGAIYPRRDTIDRRLVYEAKTGTATYGGVWGEGTGIIDSQTDVGGWPNLFTGPVPKDTDHDGMPDNWELQMGLNPNDPADRNGDLNSDGYTNLEEYLNSLTTFPEFLYPPTDLKAQLTEVDEITLSWQDNANDETGYFIESKTTGDFAAYDTVPANTDTYVDASLPGNITYTYRVQAFNETDTSIYTNEASAVSLGADAVPVVASTPYPANNATDVRKNVTLSWAESLGADSYKIYLGTSSSSISLADEVTDTFYQPDLLDPNTGYFWRVDAINANGAATGPDWTFTTKADIAPQIVGLWSFESIFRAIDSTSFDNNGDYINTSSASFPFDGPRNRAIKLNGIDQYVKVPHNAAFDFSIDDFSIAFWFKEDPVTINHSREYRYVIKGSQTENVDLQKSGKRYEVFYKPADGEVRFVIDDNVTESYVAASEDNYVTNNWVHLTAIRDAVNHELRLYADGVLVGTAADGTGDISESEDLYFGRNSSDDSYFLGEMDDVRLYNYALSDDEINKLAQEQSVGIKEKIENRMSVYPNPAKGKISVSLDLKKAGNVQLDLYNELGERVMSKNISSHSSGNHILNLETNSIRNGAYILKIQLKNEVRVFRVVIAK